MAKLVVSSIRIDKNPRHWRITVFNRGGNAGTLCVDVEDGPTFVERLFAEDRPLIKEIER